MEFVLGNMVNNSGLNTIGSVVTTESEVFKRFARILLTEEITDIQIIGHENILAKKMGQYIPIEKSPFSTKEELCQVLNILLQHSNKPDSQVSSDGIADDFTEAIIEARLVEGSRIHITTPPICDKVSCTIAKVKQQQITLENMVSTNTLDMRMAKFLAWAIDMRLSILITGETGAGKTTLLQALAKHFGRNRANEIVLVIEDTPELNIQSAYTDSIIYWRTVYGALDEKGVTLPDLVKASLRRRMDRLIISEVRGEEAFYMVDANNTGTTGTMCTLHGNDAKAALDRLASLCLRSGVEGINMNSVIRDIGNAFQIIVHQTRDNVGRYRIREIVEIRAKKINASDIKIETTPLFTYNPQTDSFQQKNRPTDSLEDLISNRMGASIPEEFKKPDLKNIEKEIIDRSIKGQY